jgi:hypothetical protein
MKKYKILNRSPKNSQACLTLSFLAPFTVDPLVPTYDTERFKKFSLKVFFLSQNLLKLVYTVSRRAFKHCICYYVL